MIKSKDGITIFFEKERSGTVYIKLRATVEINGKTTNKRVSTGLIYSDENFKKVKKEARPLFLKKLGLLTHDKLLFQDFYLKALEIVNLNANAETASERVSKVERYILPYFRDRDIKKIEASAVEEWQVLLKKQLKLLKRYENKSCADLIRRNKRLLKGIFDRAIVQGYIKFNPVLGTSQIREFKKDVHEIYTKEEIAKMISFSEGWLKVFILTFATLSLRSNEIVVLKWTDVDWNNSILRVQRAIRRGKFRKPKTGKRTVEITPSLLQVLFDFKQNSKSQYIFPQKNGEHYADAANINRRHFQPFLESIGIEYKGMYELKHTGLSIQFSEGIDPNFLCDQAGHKDKATTFKYYSKFMKNKDNILKAEKALNFNT